VDCIFLSANCAISLSHAPLPPGKLDTFLRAEANYTWLVLSFSCARDESSFSLSPSDHSSLGCGSLFFCTYISRLCTNFVCHFYLSAVHLNMHGVRVVCAGNLFGDFYNGCGFLCLIYYSKDRQATKICNKYSLHFL
jgi:hypothetical protein